MGRAARRKRERHDIDNTPIAEPQRETWREFIERIDWLAEQLRSGGGADNYDYRRELVQRLDYIGSYIGPVNRRQRRRRDFIANDGLDGYVTAVAWSGWQPSGDEIALRLTLLAEQERPDEPCRTPTSVLSAASL